MKIGCQSGEESRENKIRKWNELFSSDKHLKCRGSTASDTTTGATNLTKDTKRLKIITICNSAKCDYVNPDIYDKMYIGRMQVNMNEGKKRKFLYFQAHYVLE